LSLQARKVELKVTLQQLGVTHTLELLRECLEEIADPNEPGNGLKAYASLLDLDDLITNIEPL
jgi:hypothetical protein